MVDHYEPILDEHEDFDLIIPTHPMAEMVLIISHVEGKGALCIVVRKTYRETYTLEELNEIKGKLTPPFALAKERLEKWKTE